MTPEFAVRIFAAALTLEEAEVLSDLIDRDKEGPQPRSLFMLSAAYERRKTELEGSSRDTQTRSYPRFPKSENPVRRRPRNPGRDEGLQPDGSPSNGPVQQSEAEGDRRGHEAKN